jgi:dTDP-4-dehydrorhamnose reductase
LPEHLKNLVGGELRLDLSKRGELFAALDELAPKIVLHTAARTIPNDCELDPAGARRDNVDATRLLAEWCAQHGAAFVAASTDLVFDGQAAPYKEDAVRNPIGVYPQTKAEAEDAVLAASPSAIVARLPLMLGISPAGTRSVDEVLGAALARGEVNMFEDEFRTPIHAGLAAAAIWELVARRASGVVHVAGRTRVSRYELGAAICRAQSWPAERLKRGSIKDFKGKPPRCPDVSMDTGKLKALLGRAAPTLEESLAMPLSTARA